MRCGHCKGTGVDVAHVRSCYGMAVATPTSDMVDAVVALQEGAQDPFNPASDKQVVYALGLQDERVLPAGVRAYSEAELRKMERVDVSAHIMMLRELPWKGGKSRLLMYKDVIAGRYALLVDGVWKFYQVSKPDKGRWEGYTFIKMLVGSPGDYKEVQMRAEERSKILQRINRDVQQAMLDYGLHSGVCGKCSSPLTDPQSLERGIGPVCAKKMGW